ncbi:ATP-binding protein [Streptomyces melanogenes]|uniref:ATP-binding protein n=1 Tax=Streptomyces melanogenes TaxID=67326 RepID=UPI00167E7918|nr:AAA family ATPase [Streptomyces melanogenes]
MGSPVESPLVGRAALLRSLCRAVDAAAAGRGGLVLLAGEPGIGKTALAAEVVRYARSLGVTAAWGGCEDGGIASGLWPWQQILRTVTGRAEPLAAGPGNAVGGEDSRLALFDEIAGLLLAEGRPLVAVLDDLQWADTSSVLLLGHLGRRARHEPLLLVGTYRDVDLADDHPLRALPDTEAIELGGLAPVEVAELLGRCGEPAGTEAAVDQEQAAAVHRRTGGNPFFVQQIARLRAAGGDTGTVPVAIGRTVARRLARLPDRTAHLLSTAAVLGRTFPTSQLAAVAEIPATKVPGLLGPAVEARIVVQDGPVGYRFVHDLFREELVAGLDPARRARTHLAVAEVLEGTARPAELAWHYGQALPYGPRQPAIDHAVRAAEEAMARLAYEEAARQWRQAVRLCAPQEPGRLRLRTALAGAELSAGLREPAARGFAEVADDAGAPPDLLAAAALGLHRAGVVTGGSRRAVIGHLERAAAALREAPAGALRAEVLAALARELADGPEGDVHRARTLAQEASSAARAAGDPRAEATALFAQHDVEWGPGTASRRLALADGMATAAAAADDAALEFEGALCRYVALLELADPAAATALRRAAEVAERSRLPRPRYLVRSREAAWALMRGRYEEGGRLSDEAVELARAIGEPDGLAVAASQRIVVALAREGPGGVSAAIEEGGDAGLPPEFLPLGHCFAYLAAGRPDAAAAVLRALPAAEEVSRFRWRALAGMALDVEVAVAAAVPQVCADRYRRLLPYARETIVIGGGVAVLAPVSFYLGLAATGPAAAAHLEDALAAADRLGVRPVATRARLELGRVLLARDPGGERGRRLLSQALTLAGEQGLDWLCERARAALVQADDSHVFRREGRLWTLGYAGRTVVLKDAKGLHDLALLLSCPGQEVTATRLLTGDEAPPPGSDEVADEQARAAYRTRLDHLDQEIARARDQDDPTGLARAEDERDALIAELRRTYGLAGRRRRLGDAGERARSTVTARIRDALRHIADEHPDLGRHLAASVTTGRVCAYRPEQRVHWQV